MLRFPAVAGPVEVADPCFEEHRGIAGVLIERIPYRGVAFLCFVGSYGSLLQGIQGNYGLMLQGIQRSYGSLLQGIQESYGSLLPGIQGSYGLLLQGIKGSYGSLLKEYTEE